jgi:hypothetical protein
MLFDRQFLVGDRNQDPMSDKARPDPTQLRRGSVDTFMQAEFWIPNQAAQSGCYPDAVPALPGI